MSHRLLRIPAQTAIEGWSSNKVLLASRTRGNNSSRCMISLKAVTMVSHARTGSTIPLSTLLAVANLAVSDRVHSRGTNELTYSFHRCQCCGMSFSFLLPRFDCSKIAAGSCPQRTLKLRSVQTTNGTWSRIPRSIYKSARKW